MGRRHEKNAKKSLKVVCYQHGKKGNRKKEKNQKRSKTIYSFSMLHSNLYSVFFPFDAFIVHVLIYKQIDKMMYTLTYI